MNLTFWMEWKWEDAKGTILGKSAVAKFVDQSCCIYCMFFQLSRIWLQYK